MTLNTCTDTSLFDDIIAGRDLLVDLRLSPGKAKFALVKGQRIDAVGYYENGEQRDLSGQVTWASSDPSAGYVQSGGFFQALETGFTKITASFEGQQATAEITILENAGIIYADAAYDGGFSDGSAARPFTSVSTAVKTALEKGAASVKVAQGEYTETAKIQVNARLSILGGYNNNGPDDFDWVLDTGQSHEDDTVDPDLTVIQSLEATSLEFSEDVPADAVLAGLTIIGAVNKAALGETGYISASTAVKINSVEPTITNCKIYGGSGDNDNRAIYLNSANPIIKNSILYGGLPATHVDAPASSKNNTTILLQGSSLPTLTDNTVDGDSGGLSTYRLKLEGSSNAVIENNTINAGDAIAIDVTASAPSITGNTITGTGDSILSVRATNSTGLLLNKNTIEGAVYISDSRDVIIEENIKIGGTLTATSNSKKIIIRNNLKEDLSNQYGVSKDPVLQSVFISGSSDATLTANAMGNRLQVTDSTATMNDSFIFSDVARRGIDSVRSRVTASRNYFDLKNALSVTALYIDSPSGANTILNNVFFLSGGDYTIGLLSFALTTYIHMNNNFFHIDGGIGTRFLKLTSGINNRLYVSNNIIYFAASTSPTDVIFADFSSGVSGRIKANHLINAPATFYDHDTVSTYSIATYTSLKSHTGLEVNVSTTLGTLGFTDVSTGVGGFLEVGSEDFSACDLHPATAGSSSLIDGAVTNVQTTIDTDFDNCSRNYSDGTFAVGPFETSGTDCVLNP